MNGVFMPHNILLVEDNLIAQHIAEFVIKSCGDCVTIAATGSEALHFAAQNNYDLIILDMGLPDIDGQTIKETLLDRNIVTPIIGLTAHADLNDPSIMSKPLTRELYQQMLVNSKN